MTNRRRINSEDQEQQERSDEHVRQLSQEEIWTIVLVTRWAAACIRFWGLAAVTLASATAQLWIPAVWSWLRRNH